MDCVLMKFLMLCIRECVSFPSIGVLDFFFRVVSVISCLSGDKLRVEDGSRLNTLSEEGVTTSSGFASDAGKPLALCVKGGLVSEMDSACRNLDTAGFGGLTMIVLMFLTENLWTAPGNVFAPATDITDGLLVGIRSATGVATSIGE